MLQLKEDQGKSVDGESENNRPTTPTSDSEEQDSYEECCTVAMETKTLGPAVRALGRSRGGGGREVTVAGHDSRLPRHSHGRVSPR